MPPLSHLHTQEVTGSSPVAPTIQTEKLLSFHGGRYRCHKGGVTRETFCWAAQRCINLEQLQEFLDAVPCLVDDGGQGLPFQVVVMHGNRHAQIGTVRMLEEVVRAFDVVNTSGEHKKTGTLEGLEDFDRSQSWQVLAHAE
jgi:hypothetical protein